MASTSLGVTIVFTISSFEFTSQIAMTWFANDEWPQFNRPQSTRFVSNSGILSQAVNEDKNSPWRKALTTLLEISASNCSMYVCVFSSV